MPVSKSRIQPRKLKLVRDFGTNQIHRTMWCGQYYTTPAQDPDAGNLGCFVREAWVRTQKGGPISGYFAIHGFGGHHPDGCGLGVDNSLVFLTDTTMVSLVGPGWDEVCHLMYGWDETRAFMWYNGVIVYAKPWAGPRYAAGPTTPEAGGGGLGLHIGGTDHSNWGGRIALIRQFDGGTFPFVSGDDRILSVGALPRFPNEWYDQGSDTYYHASLNLDFTVASPIVPDLSSGYHGGGTIDTVKKRHPAVPYNYLGGGNVDHGNPAYYLPLHDPLPPDDTSLPQLVVDDEFPCHWDRPSDIKVPKFRLQNQDPSTAPSITIPGGAIVSDKGYREDKTCAFYQEAELDETEGGSAGPLAYSVLPFSDLYNPTAIGDWGVQKTHFVPFGAAPTMFVVFVPGLSGAMRTSFNRVPTYPNYIDMTGFGQRGDVGIIFRCQDQNHFCYLYRDPLSGVFRLGYIDGTTDFQVTTGSGMSNSIANYAINCTSGSLVTLYADGSPVGGWSDLNGGSGNSVLLPKFTTANGTGGCTGRFPWGGQRQKDFLVVAATP